MNVSYLFRSQLERELEDDRAELRDILELPDDSKRVERLKDLATTLGASTIKAIPGIGDVLQPELVHNIHEALQTKAMIATLQTTSNYVIVSVILAIIALLGVVIGA